ncbi:MAG: SGNH/GDSL hydrolase family protein [Actinomycetota bacterium]|nr:SGNH/GDSL hydrolase family protein [Actinomycetota bacterium]
MLRSRVPLVATVVGAVAALGIALANPAAAAGARYVALGDSYASGVGSGSYLASSGSCDRSTLAASQLWANAHAPASYVSVACSGAKTTDVNANQLSALSASTTLVSITIGGNDVNFAGTLTDCVLYSTSTCVNEINADEATARNSLPGWLDTTYNGIRSHAPNARVVVLDYPRFYHDLWYCIGLSSTDRNKINEGADVLDGVIQAAAARHGFAFADVRAAFANGHEICDGSSWLHSVDWSDITQSYHPTAAGQAGGYLPALSAVAGS